MQDTEVLVVSEVRPYTEQQSEGDFRRALESHVIEHFRKREEDIGNIHTEENSYSDI